MLQLKTKRILKTSCKIKWPNHFFRKLIKWAFFRSKGLIMEQHSKKLTKKSRRIKINHKHRKNKRRGMQMKMTTFITKSFKWVMMSRSRKGPSTRLSIMKLFKACQRYVAISYGTIATSKEK